MIKINVHREELNKNFSGKEQHKKIYTLQDTVVETEIPVSNVDIQEKENSGDVWKLIWGQKLEVA